MALFFLQLTSSESTFEYSFSQDFLSKKYEIALLKMDGKLRHRNKIRKIGVDNQNNNISEKFTSTVQISIRVIRMSFERARRAESNDTKIFLSLQL